MQVEVCNPTFQKLEAFWRDRASRPVDKLQTVKVESVIKQCLRTDDFFKDGLDLGCGEGRLLPLLSDYCGHIWAVDIIDSLLLKAGEKGANITPILAGWPYELFLPDARIDLLTAFFVFQHIVDDTIFAATVKEINRVLKPGARVIIIDNAVDTASHVRPRGVSPLVTALGLANASSKRITLGSKPNDHWLIDGIRRA
jgi:SAM-dependent methyltransferase